jgi:Transglutaminase-like superfamily
MRSHVPPRLLVLILLLCQAGCQPSPPLPAEVSQQLLSSDSTIREKAEADEGSVTADKKLPQSESNKEPETQPKVASQPFPVNESAWIRREQLPWQFAEVQYIGNTRIGFSKLIVEQPSLAELNQIRVRREDIIDRGADGTARPIRRVIYESYEKPNGELSSFRFNSTIDGVPDVAIEGRVVFGMLELTRKQGEQDPQKSKFPWEADKWGPLGIQAMLMRTPMEPGQSRNAHIFVPQLLQYVAVQLVAKQREVIPLAEGITQELLQIDVIIGSAESTVLSSLFADATGLIHKTVSRSGPEMAKFRVSAETVQRISDQLQFERSNSHQVKVQLSSSAEAGVRYLIVAKDLDPYDLILRYHRQQLKSVNPNSCELNFSTLSLIDSQLDSTETNSQYLNSSAIFPADKEAVKTLANSLLGNFDGSLAERAEKLRSEVHKQWKSMPQTGSIASTLVVAREMQGSSIDCAQLLTSLLRSQKTPARVISGLVVDRSAASAGFAAWSQAWIDGGWHDLDATIAEPVSQNHIAMVQGTESTSNPYASLLPVIEAIQQIQSIEVLDRK